MPLLAASSPLALVQLGGVLLVALGAVAWMRGRQRRGPLGGVRSIRLTAQHAVHVVDIEGRRMLVGTGPGQAPRLLTDLPAGATPSGTPQSKAASGHATAQATGWNVGR
jgi:hypothetical protein